MASMCPSLPEQYLSLFRYFRPRDFEQDNVQRAGELVAIWNDMDIEERRVAIRLCQPLIDRSE